MKDYKISEMKVISSAVQPNSTNVLWLNSTDNKLYKFGNDGWKSVSGGSSGGGGITIVDSVDQLDPSAELGSLASIVEPGSIKEVSFRDLYQPDASMLDPNTGTLTAPELLSSVSSVRVFAPQNVDSLGAYMVYLVTRDFSMTSQNMAMVQIVPQQVVGAMTMTGGYDTMQEFILAEYSQDTMSYTIHNDQVEAFNAILGNGMDWCYFGNPEVGSITEEQFATIDLFIKAVAGNPSKAHVYLKNDNWEELYAKDFEKVEKLTSDLDETKASIPTKVSQLENDAEYAKKTGSIIEVSPSYFRDSSGTRYGISVRDGASYFVTTSNLQSNFFYLNLEDYDERERTATVYLYASSYNLFILLGNNNVTTAGLSEYSFDVSPGVYEINIKYRAIGGKSLIDYFITSCSIKKTSYTLNLITCKLTSGEKTYDGTGSIYVNGRPIRNGEVFNEEGDAVILYDNMYYIRNFIDSSSPVCIYAQSSLAFHSIPSNTEVQKIFLSESINNIRMKFNTCDEVHLYSLEERLEYSQQDYPQFKSTCKLYVKDDLWDFHIPASVTKLSKNVLSGLSIDSLYFDGDLPELDGDSYRADTIYIKNYNNLFDGVFGKTKSSSPCLGSANLIVSNGAIRYLFGREYIGHCANAINITSLIINSCFEILNNAFSNCSSLKYCHISNCSYIRSAAFANCTSALYYDFSNTVDIPVLDSNNCFYAIPSNCKIIVPDSLYDRWIVATNWAGYADHIIKKSDWDAQQTTV